MAIAAVLSAWVLMLAGVYLVGRQWATRRRSRERIFEAEEAVAATPGGDEPGRFLQRWLFRAGYRSPSATSVFLAVTAGLVCVGGLFACVVYAADVGRRAEQVLTAVPGGLGDILLPFVYAAPWLVLLILASVPALMVRGVRRQRVTQVEQDLPLILDLLATLGEAGLGFDAGLERVLTSQPSERPLTQELRQFQLEILAGRPRVQCLRRLGWRLDVMPLTIFVSALVQAEQVGAGVADVLRRQADDLRGRRREHALTVAAALPVKLLFPLVICFLPGVLVATLGPTFFQIFQLFDTMFRARGLR